VPHPSPKHLTLASPGNDAGGSILAAKVPQFLAAVDNRRTTVLDIVAFKVDTRAWLESLTEEQRQRAIDLAEGHSTQECARRWNVSEPAVSLYRRQLNRSYERFMAR